MLRILSAIIAATCLSMAFVSSEDAQLGDLNRQQQLDQRAKLVAEFRAAQESGSSDKTIAIAERIAELERKLTGDPDQDESAQGQQLRAALLNSLAGTLGWLSSRYEASEQFQQAIKTQQELVTLRTGLLGDDHPETADARVRLIDLEKQAKLTSDQREQLRQTNRLHSEAMQLFRNGEPQKALELEQRVLQTRQKILGDEAPPVVVTHHYLGFLSQQTGDLEQSVEHLRIAQRLQSQRLGRNHPEWRRAVESLADVLSELGNQALAEDRFDEARRYQTERLARLIDRYGATDYRVTDARLAGADIERLASMVPENRKELRRAEQLNDRADELYRSGSYAEAVPLAQSAIEIFARILGDKHPARARSLNNLGRLYQDMRKYAQAEPLYVEAKAIREKVFGKQNPYYASSLDSLAWLYWWMGDYARAEPLYVEAKTIREKVLGKEHPDYATSLQGLACLYQSMGDSARAEPLFVEARAILKKTRGKEHADYATSLNNLGWLYWSMGDYARAEPLYVEAKAIVEKVLGKEHPDYASSLNNLGRLYQDMQKYAQAEPLYVEAKAIREKVLGKEHPDYAASLNSLASFYQWMGDHMQAEPLFVEAKTIREKVLGKEHPDYASALHNLGSSYWFIGNYARAEPLYVKAKAIREKALGKEHPDYARSLSNLAGLHWSMGDYARAEPLFVEAKAILEKMLGEEHPRYAASLNNLAALYWSMRDYARAEPLYVEAKAILEKVLGKEHPDYAGSLNNLGVLYKWMGDYARAEPLFVEAKAIREKVLGKEHPDYAGSLNNLGRLYRSMGDDARAEPLCVEAKAILEKMLGEEHPRYAASLSYLAGLYHSMGDYARADEQYKKAVDITLGHLDETAYILSERQQMLMDHSVRYQLDNYLRCCLEGGLNLQDAIARLVAWKGSILLRQRGLRLAASDPSITEPFRKLQSIAQQLSTTVSSIPGPKQLDNWKRQIAVLTGEKEKLEADLMRRSAAFREVKKKITLDSIRQAIPSDAVLVDYLEYGIQGQRMLLASVIPPRGEVRLIDLGSAVSASKAIDTWRESYGMTAEAQAAGRELRRQIWEPLAQQINDAELILISTDGVLGKLPFAALPGSQADSYLIEDHRMALIPVPQLLPALVKEQGGEPLKRELLLVGDVDYEAQLDTKAESADAKDQPVRRKRPWERNRPLADSLRGGSKWGPLSETGEEVEVIAGLYRRLYEPEDDAVLDLRKTEATESAFRQHAPQCMLLHLATHGFFAAPEAKSALSAEAIAESQRDPVGRFGGQRELIRGHSPGQLSGLVFAGANHPPQIDPLAEQTPDDGIMTADEIAFLPLGGVRLAVLSACETGLGEVAGGEGLLGIQRSFQVAGARTTIATLWKVNDPATRRLMGEFYTNYLEKEMSIVDALRETQLWALNHPGDVPRGAKRVTVDEAPKRLEPQFWAPFVLSGDWR